MALVTISAQIDANDKIRFSTFCDNVGLSTSSALNMFIKAVLREDRIPFEIKYSAKNTSLDIEENDIDNRDVEYMSVEESLKESCQEMMNIRKGVQKGKSWDDLMKELTKEELISA